MTRIIQIAFASLLFGAVANASMCPEANYDACTGIGYAIVETEPIEHIPHNQMESAHRLYYTTVTTTYKQPVRRKHHTCWH